MAKKRPPAPEPPLISGKDLRDLIKAHKMTPSEVAEAAGMHRQGVDNILSGRRAASLQVLARILEAIGGGVGCRACHETGKCPYCKGEGKFF